MTSLEPKRKRNKTLTYSEESLRIALLDIREKKKGIREACREYGIPRTTIQDRLSGKTSDVLKTRGPDPILGKDGEQRLVDWVISIAKCGFPVKKHELLDTVQKILKDSKKPNCFKDDRPGQTYLPAEQPNVILVTDAEKDEEKKNENEAGLKMEILTKGQTILLKDNNNNADNEVHKIQCSLCEDILISDAEEDEDKNIGCDICPRWYHLKCTDFIGLSYVEVKDKSFNCHICN